MNDFFEGWETPSILKSKRVLLLLGTLGILFFVLSFVINKNSETVVDVSLPQIENTKEADEIVVDVSGAVMSPGVYKLKPNSRVVDAINIANGFDKNVNSQWLTQHLNLAEKITDGQKLYVPFEWDVVLEGDIELGIFPNDLKLSNQTEEKEEKVNINKDSKNTLETLPGIGPVYASKIIDNRPYQSIKDFKLKVDIPSSVLNSIESHITL